MELADSVTSADLSTEPGWSVIGRGKLGALEGQNSFACHTPLGGSEQEGR